MEEGKTKYETEHQIGLTLLCHGLKEIYSLDLDMNDLLNMIAHGKYGKPYLIDFDNIHFNISHCDGLVACAISDRPIGIDVERIVPFKDNLAKKILTEEEMQFLICCKNDEIAYKEMFFRLWTLKESYIKWNGSGFFKEPKAVSFGSSLSEKVDELSCSDDRVCFRQKKIEENCILSICGECRFGDEWDIRWMI